MSNQLPFNSHEGAREGHLRSFLAPIGAKKGPEKGALAAKDLFGLPVPSTSRFSKRHLHRWAATLFAAGMLSVVPSAQALDLPFFSQQIISTMVRTVLSKL